MGLALRDSDQSRVLERNRPVSPHLVSSLPAGRVIVLLWSQIYAKCIWQCVTSCWGDRAHPSASHGDRVITLVFHDSVHSHFSGLPGRPVVVELSSVTIIVLKHRLQIILRD